MSRCCKGLDVILDRSRPVAVVGAQSPGTAKKYIVMHIENPKGLVAKAKGEGLAWATDMLVPEFIENQIYSTVADEFKKQFREKGSEVSVQITQSPPDGVSPTSDLKGGIFLGLLLGALGYGAVKLVTR